MNPSEERVSGASETAEPKTARILPFERPPSDLQRAMQLRAQEALERDRDRGQRRPAPLRWAIIMVLAAVPVLLLFGAVDGFLRALQKYNEIVFKSEPPQSSSAAPGQTEASTAPSQTEEGVVMLESFGGDASGEAATKPPAESAPASPPSN